MKQILVVCVGIPTGESITAELNTIFRGVAQAEFCLCHQLREQAEGRDIVLFSSKYSQALCPDVIFSAAALPAQRVINYRNLQEVIELEAGSRVLLVNDDKDTAAEAIGQLMEIGLTDLRYVPCYPGSPGHPEISIAITPGERAYVPSHAPASSTSACVLWISAPSTTWPVCWVRSTCWTRVWWPGISARSSQYPNPYPRAGGRRSRRNGCWRASSTRWTAVSLMWMRTCGWSAPIPCLNPSWAGAKSNYWAGGWRGCSATGFAGWRRAALWCPSGIGPCCCGSRRWRAWTPPILSPPTTRTPSKSWTGASVRTAPPSGAGGYTPFKTTSPGTRGAKRCWRWRRNSPAPGVPS